MTDTFAVDRIAWVYEDDDLAVLLGEIEQAPVVVYDLETTGLDEHAVTDGRTNAGIAARVVMASFTLPRYDEHGRVKGEPSTYLLPLSHPESMWMGSWRAVLTRLAEAMKGRRLVGHNIKFDNRWMYALTGVNLAPSTWWDTMISSHLLDENSPARLKERAPRTFGIEAWDDVELKSPGAAEREGLIKLGIYAARDTYWTWKLYEKHYRAMVPENPDELFDEEEQEVARLGYLMQWCAMPTTRTLTAIEQRGMELDTEWVREEITRMEELRESARSALVHRYTGMDPDRASFAATSIWFMEWAQKAVDNGDLKVAALTPTGKPQWSKKVLTRQAREGSEVASLLLDHRKAVKRLEFLRSWMDQLTRTGGIHSTYNQGSVVTGRLSSSGPNMQQVTYELRPAFVPSPGHVLADLDYSQIELRVAAFVSRSDPMMSAYQNGEDLHSIMASRISGKPIEAVTKQERQAGKAANFGLLYGMGAYGFREYAETAYGVHLTDHEAAVIHQTFFETWDGIRQWHTRQINTAQSRGQVISPIGRVRRLPGVWSDNDREATHAERNSINSPVQGFASDIMQIAAGLIEGEVPGFGEGVKGARLVGTVHDSIIVEVPADDWRYVTWQCKKVMEEQVPKVLERLWCTFDVPLQADASVGTRWGLSDVGEL